MNMNEEPLNTTRTIEEETGRDLLSAILSKYFLIIMGCIFAILLHQPETASGFWIGSVALRSVIHYYLIIGFFGLLGFEGLVMTSKRNKSEVRIPIWGFVLFGIYSLFGFYLFLTLFNNLLNIANAK